MSHAVAVRAAVFFAVATAFSSASAQDGALEFAEPNCGVAAVAQPAAPLLQFVQATPDGLSAGQVAITYSHHSTFLIETSEGVSAATDFADYAPVDAAPASAFRGHGGSAVIPDVVTMNGAQDSHHTIRPHPEIGDMLMGWSVAVGPVAHELIVGGLRVRNVSTDLFRTDGVRIEDANSIFVFEFAGLCIGHLGHLHRPLTPEQRAAVGQLDVAFVPVDGVDLMRPEDLRTEADRLGVRVVIPMHAFTTGALEHFVAVFAESYEIVTPNGPTLVLSQDSLPDQPVLALLTEAAR